MSKRCPECLYTNDDSRIFCSACGAPLDAQLRLIQDLEKQKELSKEPAAPKQRGDVNFYTPRRTPQKKKSSAAPWVIFFLAAAVAMAVWFFMNQ